MPKETREEYFNGRIVKVNGPDKILECMNKLHPASVANYAHIHADGEAKNSFGGNINSKLAIRLQEGSGETKKVVRVNISPEEAEYIYQGVCQKDTLLSLENLKIFGEPNKEGRCRANVFKLGYDSRPDKSGKQRRSPWLLKLSEGTGIKKKNKNGGSYCEGGSYKAEKESYIYLDQYEMFRFFLRIKKFIDTWEFFMSQFLFDEGIKAQETAYQEWLGSLDDQTA